MDPRTFLPPRDIPTAELPQPGDRAPQLPDGREVQGPAVVAFLRHTGCAFAEATMQSLRECAEEHPDITFLAVSHTKPEATERWLGKVGGAGHVEVLSDLGRETYAAWGLGRTSIGHFMGRRSLREIGRLARRGIRNRHPTGTRWQRAGTFAVDSEGVVRWRHVPEHAGDLPDIAVAVAVARV